LCNPRFRPERIAESLLTLACCAQITNKFIAFVGPKDRATAREFGVFDHEPADFIDEFSYRDVSTVVRLNEASTYDKTAFTSQGIQHFDIYFDDCSVPSAALVQEFLDVCDSAPGVIAVHCLAGLGRTVCKQLLSFGLMFSVSVRCAHVNTFKGLFFAMMPVPGRSDCFMHNGFIQTCARGPFLVYHHSIELVKYTA
jgi:hypothetical protein